MTATDNRRTRYRRYSDRRIALMLQVHEHIFNYPPGVEREGKILDTICAEYGTDRGAIVSLSDDLTQVAVTACGGNWVSSPISQRLVGPGIGNLISLHQKTDGVITFTKFRRPNAFDTQSWTTLWQSELKEPASGLLSSPINPESQPPSLLWLMINSSSREWSSHDRELAEEVTQLLAKAIDKSNRAS